MIVTLVPFILAARLNFPATSWKDGNKAQVTYLIQNLSTKTYSSGGTNSSDEILNLKTLFTCQHLLNKLACYFHNVDVKTTYADGSQGGLPGSCPKFYHEDMWLKKNLLQNIIQLGIMKDGYLDVFIPIEVESTVQNIIEALVHPLAIGLNFSTQLEGIYETRSNITEGKCRTIYLVTRTTDAVDGYDTKNSPFKLFLVAHPHETLDKSVEILRHVEDEKCNELFYKHSIFAAREFKKLRLKPLDVDIKSHSRDSFTSITQNNFTSFTKNIISIIDNKDSTKYILEESLSMSLQKIEGIQCDAGDPPRFPQNCISKGLKKFKSFKLLYDF